MIIQFKSLEKKVKRIRKKNPKIKIVTTNGCFDLLTPGHIYSLMKARMQGDILIVGINTDRYIRKYKKREPFFKQRERAIMLNSIRYVNYVTIFPSKTSTEFVRLVKPNVHVKGAEYKRKCVEEKEVKKHGKLYFIKMLPRHHSSNFHRK